MRCQSASCHEYLFAMFSIEVYMVAPAYVDVGHNNK